MYIMLIGEAAGLKEICVCVLSRVGFPAISQNIFIKAPGLQSEGLELFGFSLLQMPLSGLE